MIDENACPKCHGTKRVVDTDRTIHTCYDCLQGEKPKPIERPILDERDCPRCHGTRRVREKDGTIHICFDCLNSGRLDQHDKKLKDAQDLGIKL